MQEYRGFNSVRTRLIFWFLVVSISPLLIISAFMFYWEVQSIKSEVFRKLIAVRDLKVNEINHWLDERIGDIRTISEDQTIRKVADLTPGVEIQNEHRQKIREILERYVSNYLAYNELFILNASTGRIEISSNSSSEGLDRSKYVYFIEAVRTKDLYIQDIYYSKAIDRPSMTFSIPIFSLNPPESLIGVLVARIDLERSLYIPLLDRAGMGDSGETLIVNSDVVALNKLRWHSNAPLTLKIGAEPALKASQGESGITETGDYRDEKVLAAYTHIPRTGWGLVSKQDLKEVYAPIRSMLRNTVVILLITALGVYVFAFTVAKIISRPVIGMIEVSRKIAEGDLLVRNRATGPDEFRYLAKSFNNMADSVMSRMEIQKGVRAITNTMVASGEVKEFCQELLNKVMEITGSSMGALHMLNIEENRYEHLVSNGVSGELLDHFDAEFFEGEFGAALATKKITRIKDIPDGTIFKFKSFTGIMLPKEIVTIPVMVKERVKAVISLASLVEYSEEAIEILERCWMALNTGFSNLHANEEMREIADVLDIKNRELEALAQELRNQSEELRAQNLELEQQRKRLEDASRVKNEFFSNMSHELRTPLNSIMALSRVLLTRSEEVLSGEEISYLEIIERNGRQLLSLINDILNLSKLEAGRTEFYTESFSIGSAIEVVIENLSPVAEEKGIRIIDKIPHELPDMESDQGIVNQILQNIIGNAVKFTEQGSITVIAESDDKEIRIIIKDSGIGITKEELPHIFEEFRQADGSPSRRYDGTGLGLAIAHKAVKLLRGDITVESVPGVGSTFTVTMPLKFSKEEDKYLRRSEALEKIEVEPEGKRSRKILLVEDNEIALFQIKHLLEKEGYLVDVTRNGQEALDYIKDRIPDGVILDLMMPEVDGFEVLEKIKSKRETASIPVIILTAMDLSDKELKRLRFNNIEQLIQKGDVNKEELLKRIRSMLGESTSPVERRDLPFEEGEGAEQSGMERGPRHSGENPERPVILVIEDKPDNLTTIRAILQDDYNIIEASDGEMGLEWAISRHPDLILLDISLPKMDGYAVAKNIRGSDRAGKIPVIALTAHAMMGDREKMINAGCNDYLSKPIDSEMLKEKVRKWLRRS